MEFDWPALECHIRRALALKVCFGYPFGQHILLLGFVVFVEVPFVDSTCIHAPTELQSEKNRHGLQLCARVDLEVAFTLP